ncbi:MAG TPA: cytochrome c3 family protein, partial [Myxococcales bacterium]
MKSALTRLCLALAALTVSGAAAEQFARKDCLDCHAAFREKVLSRTHLHSSVKQQKCEDCHIRHGIVPKLILRESGNKLCLECHKPGTVGLDKAVVHKPLKSGECVQCHDAHGSNAPLMLKTEGTALCFGCHAPQPFQRKNVHAALKEKGCAACHSAHATAERQLLTAKETQLCSSCHKPSEAPFRKAHAGYPV